MKPVLVRRLTILVRNNIIVGTSLDRPCFRCYLLNATRTQWVAPAVMGTQGVKWCVAGFSMFGGCKVDVRDRSSWLQKGSTVFFDLLESHKNLKQWSSLKLDELSGRNGPSFNLHTTNGTGIWSAPFCQATRSNHLTHGLSRHTVSRNWCITVPDVVPRDPL